MNPATTPRANLRSPAFAYRKDLSRANAQNAFGKSDGHWLAFASLLHHAALVPPQDAARLCASALDQARAMVDRAALERGCQLDARGRQRCPSDAVRIVSEQMENAGALNLARAVIDATVAAFDITPHERGLLLAHRARLCWKLGELDAAVSVYTEVETLGSATNDIELRLRAWIGFAALAQQRGNYPEVRRLCENIVRDASAAGLKNLAAAGEHGLMAAAGVAGDFDTAAAHAWNEYEQVAGDPIAEADVLHNVSTLLLKMGDAESAVNGYAAVFARKPPLRIVLQSLGCYAHASGILLDGAAVRWAAAELSTLGNADEHPYPTALGYMECARGLALVDDLDVASRMRDEAIRVANGHGFYEVALLAEAIDVSAAALQQRPTAPELPSRARGVAAQLRRLRPLRVPAHVSVST